jgi:hypothetical protein
MSVGTSCLCGTCANCTTGGTLPTGPLDAATWRHSAIRTRLLDRIGRIAINEALPLASLTTRASDDPAIALIDAFAGSLHIVAWNAAQLADDATLARSQDPQALADLAALTGYQPRPALSATTMLSFTLDQFPGSPAQVTIPKGNRVASLPTPPAIPGTPAMPISFETDADLIAQPGWSSLAPVIPTSRQTIDTTSPLTISVPGISFAGRVGDIAMLAMDTPLTLVTEDRSWGTVVQKAANRQKLALRAQYIANRGGAGAPDIPPPKIPPPEPVSVTEKWVAGPILAVTIFDKASPQRVDVTILTSAVSGPDALDADLGMVILLGTRSASFGANAPDPQMLAAAVDATLAEDKIQVTDPAPPTEWPALVMLPPGQTGSVVDIDGSRPEAIPGRMLYFGSPTVSLAARIDSSADMSRAGFGLSGKVTRTAFEGFTLDGTNFNAAVRETAIYIETARVALLQTPDDVSLPDPATPDQITVASAVSLPVARQVLLAGTAIDPISGLPVTASETAVIRACMPATDGTATASLTFTAPLANLYQGSSLTIYGNVVSASQGESSASGAELLGSGDASVLNPRYSLSRAPVTQLPAQGVTGYAPELVVTVDGRQYQALPNLCNVPASTRAYMVEMGRDGKNAVRFAGRLPTAANSVKALYRAGAGSAGNLAAGTIITALAPVPGVRAVTNPIPADGGSDAETPDTIRSSVPAKLGTFDRVVSLTDYQAYAAAYPGVGKALASDLSIGMRRIVLLTIASTSLAQPGTALIAALTTAIQALSAPGRSVAVQGFAQVTPILTIAYASDPAFARPDIETAIRAALAATFGRATMAFAQGIAQSQVIACVQGIAGVIGVTLPIFTLPNVAGLDNGRLLVPGPAAQIDPVSGLVIYSPAGLCAIDPAQVRFEDMAL